LKVEVLVKPAAKPLVNELIVLDDQSKHFDIPAS